MATQKTQWAVRELQNVWRAIEINVPEKRQEEVRREIELAYYAIVTDPERSGARFLNWAAGFLEDWSGKQVPLDHLEVTQKMARAA